MLDLLGKAHPPDQEPPGEEVRRGAEQGLQRVGNRRHQQRIADHDTQSGNCNEPMLDRIETNLGTDHAIFVSELGHFKAARDVVEAKMWFRTSSEQVPPIFPSRIRIISLSHRYRCMGIAATPVRQSVACFDWACATIIAAMQISAQTLSKPDGEPAELSEKKQGCMENLDCQTSKRGCRCRPRTRDDDRAHAENARTQNHPGRV